MDVIFINLFWGTRKISNVRLSSFSLACFLENNGITTDIISLDIDGNTDIDTTEPIAFAFSPTTPTYNSAVRIMNKLKVKFPDAQYIIGNAHANALPELCLRDGFDYVFLGDGYGSLLSFVVNLKMGVTPNKKIICSVSVPFVRHTNAEKYKNTISPFPFPAVTRQGCVYKCEHCSVANMYGSEMLMDIPAIVESIQLSNTDRIKFINPCFDSVERVVELGTRLDEVGMSLPFDIVMRPEPILHSARYNLSGFFYFLEKCKGSLVLEPPFGIGRNSKEYPTKEITEHCIELLEKYDVNAKIHFMFGYPEDTYETLDKICDFIYRHRNVRPINIQVLTPYPGTQLYNELTQSDNIIDKNWDNWRGMSMVFKHPNMDAEQASSMCQTRAKIIKEMFI